MDEELRAIAEQAGIEIESVAENGSDHLATYLAEFAVLVAERAAMVALARAEMWRLDGSRIAEDWRDEAQRCAVDIRALAARWRGAPGVER